MSAWLCVSVCSVCICLFLSHLHLLFFLFFSHHYPRPSSSPFRLLVLLFFNHFLSFIFFAASIALSSSFYLHLSLRYLLCLYVCLYVTVLGLALYVCLFRLYVCICPTHNIKKTKYFSVYVCISMFVCFFRPYFFLFSNSYKKKTYYLYVYLWLYMSVCIFSLYVSYTLIQRTLNICLSICLSVCRSVCVSLIPSNTHTQKKQLINKRKSFESRKFNF